MHSKKHRILLAALLVATPIFTHAHSVSKTGEIAEATVTPIAESTSPESEKAVVPVELSEEELVELIGYLTAQGHGIGYLQFEKDDVVIIADSFRNSLSGELDPSSLSEAIMQAAYSEARARAAAIKAGEKELPAMTASALKNLAAEAVMQSGLYQLGFDENEIDLIHQGFVAGAQDATPDPSVKAKIPVFQAFMQKRAEAAMMKNQAAMMKASEADNQAAMKEFEAVITEWKTKENFNVVLDTTQGPIEIELMPSVAPIAVANFVGHIQDGYYNDLIFHRVIDGFMIQGGDPLGTGTGGESIWGKDFPDEFSEDVKFDKVGILAMANAGPMTNGSQFFITTSTPAGLNFRHTIFGKVVKGYDNVKKIEQVETGAGDKPIEAQKIVKAYVVE